DGLFTDLEKRDGARDLVVLMSTGAFGGLFQRLAGEVWEPGNGESG
ncbi:MAG: hypothetical protein GXO34_06725, partial [Deltaproteobacteria bacterium]|nr:hypothetical protein [Deltaproteobacteria bacterium]